MKKLFIFLIFFQIANVSFAQQTGNLWGYYTPKNTCNQYGLNYNYYNSYQSQAYIAPRYNILGSLVATVIEGLVAYSIVSYQNSYYANYNYNNISYQTPCYYWYDNYGRCIGYYWQDPWGWHYQYW